MQPQITVVIPLYNKGALIKRALASVAAQTSPADRIIVIDDASTDDGAALVREHALPNLTLLQRSEPGPGGYAARNLGVTEAVTEWVAFLDADDSWEPRHLQSLREAIAFAGPACGAAFSGFNNVYEDGRSVRDRYSRQAPAFRTLTFDDFLAAWASNQRCPVQTSASAFRRQVLIDCGLFPAGRARRGGDKDTWLRAFSRTIGVAAAEPTVNYSRDAPNMVTHTATTNVRSILIDTLADLARAAPSARTRGLLARISNLEILGYAVSASRQGRISKTVYQDFDWSQNLAASLGLRLLALSPKGPLRPLARILIGRSIQ